jgi:putative phosphoesterase
VPARVENSRDRPAGSRRSRIGVISDTHGLMRPEALAALQGVDAILHAGDIGGEHVIEALRAIAPVTFVLGNNDDSDGYDIVRVTIGNLRILLTHIYRPELLQQDADVIVFGHSHQARNEVVDGVLLFNPASAGPRRFKLPVMVGIIEGKRAYHVKLM